MELSDPPAPGTIAARLSPTRMHGIGSVTESEGHTPSPCTQGEGRGEGSSTKPRNFGHDDRTPTLALPRSTGGGEIDASRGKSHGHRGRFDRQLLIALSLAALVVTVRSVLIELAHSETVDAEYHLNRGIAFLTGTVGRRILNDPPLGEALCAVPMWLSGCVPGGGARGLYGHHLKPETILCLIAVWKSLLFVPLVGVAFWWCRRLYGLASAWLATALLLIEPTFAAHVGLPTVDVLGVEGIAIACIVAWRYFQQPSTRRLNYACLAIAVALLLKHTSVLVPLLVVIYAILWWHLRLWLAQRGIANRSQLDPPPWRTRFAAVGRAALLIPVMVWAFTLFDFTPPSSYLQSTVLATEKSPPNEPPLLNADWPAGMYVGSFIQGLRHNTLGHPNYLWGRNYTGALWYYFPVVAMYKVPLGIGAVMLLGLASLAIIKPRWDEWSLLIPMVGYTVWLMTTRINIGFRHFLPAYVFMLLLACRCVASDSPSPCTQGEGWGKGDSNDEKDESQRWRIRWSPGKWWLIAAWAGVLAGGLHALSYHPDYLSYISFPRAKPYLDISDSNIDWGQSLKQVRTWVKRFQRRDKRPVYLRYFGNDRESIKYYLDGLVPTRVKVLGNVGKLPPDGVLIISPIRLAGVYDPQDRYAALRKYDPVAVIGHSMLVYDLDKIRRRNPRFRWTKPREGPPAGRIYGE